MVQEGQRDDGAREGHRGGCDDGAGRARAAVGDDPREDLPGTARGVVLTQAPGRRERRVTRRRRATALAQRHGGVVSRKLLLANGVTREDMRTEVRAGVWHRAGVHTLCIDGPEPRDDGLLWRAVWESGARSVLDGASALICAGLTGWAERVIHVSVPHNAKVRPLAGVEHHLTKDLGAVDHRRLPHTVTSVAAVRAAQWARSDAQAATVLAMSVQQKLVRPDQLLAVWATVHASPRGEFLRVVMQDICAGAESLNELDVARLCRQRGFPPPTRQAVRRGQNGRVYLDVYWDELGVHLEIHGAHHFTGLNGVADALRANDQAIRHVDDIQLTLPVLGLRTQPEAFLDQIGRALQVGAARRSRPA